MWEQIRSNQIRSVILVATLGIVLLLLGYVLGEVLLGSWVNGLIIAVVFFAALNLVAYFEGDNIILSVSQARKISKGDHPRLYNVIEEMKIASGLEYMPAVYIIDDSGLNAFATGREPKKSSIAITSGLLQKLNRDELQGVIAHEMAHIKNRDVLLMSMCGTLLGMVLMLGEITIGSIRHSLHFVNTRRDYHYGGDSMAYAKVLLLILLPILCLLGIVTVIIVPIAAQLIYFAISRRREYLADASAALYTRYPAGLASALEKIGSLTGQLRSATRTTAPMYIVNPFQRSTMAASGLTGTHPPLWERIFILRNMGGGAGLADYERAYEKANEGGKRVISTKALAGASAVAAIAPVSSEHVSDRLEMARETSDALWKQSKHSTVNCECGVKLRVPQRYAHSSVKCPRCGRSNPL